MKIENWGQIHYLLSTEKQLHLVEEVSEGADERIIFCTHPPVVTLGRAAVADDILHWQGETIEASRGGRATYHGPNQIVIYPILDLKKEHRHFRARDIHAYLRALEDATVLFLKQFGLENAESRTSKIGDVSLTGVWVGDKKIASIGIAVRKWVTYHGIAINIFSDKTAFQGIRPCGFDSNVMTSLEDLLQQKIDPTHLQHICEETFSYALTADSAHEKRP